MPAWWGKKSTKVKDPQSNSANSSSSSINFKSDLVKNGKKKSGREQPIRNFDEFTGTALSKSSPRKSRDFGLRGGAGGEGSSGFSGFDSPSSSDIVYPLPKPANDHHSIHGGGVFGLGSGSVSVSSVSSSGSCDDHPHLDLGQPCSSRGHYDAKSSPLPSPGPASRGNTTNSSPLHPRLSALSLDSSSGRLDDWRSECHLLPLPPGSPTSPPALPTPRTPVMTESSTTLSRWKKGRLLGRGTFGHVYVGFNSDNGQMCAIKEVRVVADDQSSKECLKQLNQEITLLSQLSHPNIVQYYGSELCEESLGVYLEYVSGGSIHKLLQEYGPFREPVIQNYTRQILSGLAYLHGRSTVHRDIKGANILVDPNGEVKLADFGMAKHITSAASMLSFKGSPYWMAPEVVMNTNGYNLAVDIWSLGCTILEMATSKPPWHQFEGVAAIFKIGNSKDMPDIPDHLSSEAKGFVRLCLQRDPMRRPTAAQLLDHPFVRDQSTTSGANVNITKQAFPRAFGGSRTPTALEMRGVRNNVMSFESEVAARPNFSGSRSLMSPRSENVRSITSLPVSPSSSPLRQQRSEPVSCLVSPQRSEPVSCLVSPQHPSFPSQSGFTMNDQSIFMMRPNITRTMLDPWLDAPQSRAQIPNIFPRTRPIL